MTLCELARVVTIAEEACASIIEHSEDGDAREALNKALVPLATAAAVRNPPPAYLYGLIRQSCTLGEILRERMGVRRTRATRDSLAQALIQDGARNLRQVLSELILCIAATQRGKPDSS